MPEGNTPAPQPGTPVPQPEVPDETLPPTFAPGTATPAPAPTPVPVPTGNPAPTRAPRASETPAPRSPEPGSGTRNLEKYPYYDQQHIDRRLNVPADPDCRAPVAGIPSLLSLEDPVSV